MMSEKLLKQLFEVFRLIPSGRWQRYPFIMG